MKKFQFTHTLLAAALMTTALPMQAQVPAQSQNLTFKQKAKNRFNESVTRFKRCLKRECSRGELVKVGKDLVAAVGALIVVGGIGYIATRKKSQSPSQAKTIQVGDIVTISGPAKDYETPKDYKTAQYKVHKITPEWGMVDLETVGTDEGFSYATENVTKVGIPTATTPTARVFDSKGSEIIVDDMVKIVTPSPDHFTEVSTIIPYKVTSIDPDDNTVELEDQFEKFRFFYPSANLIKEN